VKGVKNVLSIVAVFIFFVAVVVVAVVDAEGTVFKTLKVLLLQRVMFQYTKSNCMIHLPSQVNSF
jgi:hypothetical protein